MYRSERQISRIVHNRIMQDKPPLQTEPRWPAALAMLSIGGLYSALPSQLSIGPDWMGLVLVAALTIPAIVFNRRGNWRLSQSLGYAASTVVTLSVVISLTLLISRLPAHKE